MMNFLLLYVIPYGLLFVFLIRVIIYIFRHKKNGFRKANHYFLENIPSIFTTIGIFGTFLGIVCGLWTFDSENIDASIPQLLGGLKTSFLTSLFGLIFSLVFKSLLDYLKNTVNSDELEPVDDELNALKLINRSLVDLNKSIVGKSDESISSEFLKLRTLVRDSSMDTKKVLKEIKDDNLKIAKDSLDANNLIVEGLGGDGETSLLSQLIRFREEARENTGEQLKAVQSIEGTMTDNTKMMAGKFDEFSDLLEKSNTDALVAAIENVMRDFNAKFNDLISKLVQENFAELNESVKSLNNWQQEYKVAVSLLIDQLKEASGNFVVSAKLMENVSNSTDRLTNNSGRLAKLINELEDVILKEGLFKNSVENLHNSTKELHESSLNFKDWSKSERNLVDEVSDLVDNLKEIKNLKDKSSDFWKDIKLNLEESNSIISNGNKSLMDNVEILEQSFNERMDSSFRSLDKVLQAMVMKYKEESINFLGINN